MRILKVIGRMLHLHGYCIRFPTYPLDFKILTSVKLKSPSENYVVLKNVNSKISICQNVSSMYYVNIFHLWHPQNVACIKIQVSQPAKSQL